MSPAPNGSIQKRINELERALSDAIMALETLRQRDVRRHHVDAANETLTVITKLKLVAAGHRLP